MAITCSSSSCDWWIPRCSRPASAIASTDEAAPAAMGMGIYIISQDEEATAALAMAMRTMALRTAALNTTAP